ncbi:MAG: FitA-like ribbon-helix-helix domain-containing protein [Rhodoferax sp.]
MRAGISPRKDHLLISFIESDIIKPHPEETAMPSVTIRKLPEETHRALKARAALHGCSTEAEIRNILEGAVRPKVGLGTRLAQIGRDFGGIELEIRRDKSPVALAEFE